MGRSDAYRDDPEVLSRRRVASAADMGPLFQAFPKAPPATDEQRVIPLRTTLEGAYQAWRRTTEGELMYRAFCREALDAVSVGASRLSGKAIGERIRQRHRRELNNSYIALMVRDCEADHPVTRRFEKRQRRAV